MHINLGTRHSWVVTITLLLRHLPAWGLCGSTPSNYIQHYSLLLYLQGHSFLTPIAIGTGSTTEQVWRLWWSQNTVRCWNQTLTPQFSGLFSYWAIPPPVREYFEMPHECPIHEPLLENMMYPHIWDVNTLNDASLVDITHSVMTKLCMGWSTDE